MYIKALQRCGLVYQLIAGRELAEKMKRSSWTRSNDEKVLQALSGGNARDVNCIGIQRERTPETFRDVEQTRQENIGRMWKCGWELCSVGMSCQRGSDVHNPIELCQRGSGSKRNMAVAGPDWLCWGNASKGGGVRAEAEAADGFRGYSRESKVGFLIGFKFHITANGGEQRAASRVEGYRAYGNEALEAIVQAPFKLQLFRLCYAAVHQVFSKPKTLTVHEVC
ncbi:hypothetical protein B0H19DRAFT_1073760 [Mycena capillaripes]|nr:hypothetical protein B0H19DRAFT_1073760 [Mycena capillaripes]